LDIRHSALGIPREPALRDALLPYKGPIAGLVALTIAGNGLNLIIPWLVARAIDAYTRDGVLPPGVTQALALAAIGVFAFALLQGFVQVYASERVARDLRTRSYGPNAIKIHATNQRVTPAPIHTNNTTDDDPLKNYLQKPYPTK
jgi:ATP-binding cassette subfamily B protein